MQGGRQKREHCHLSLGRTWQPYSARRHHQADQRVGLMMKNTTLQVVAHLSSLVFMSRRNNGLT